MLGSQANDPRRNQITAEQPPEVAPPVAPQARPRQTDQGPEILPCMERFVTLVRKCKRPALVLALVERAGPVALPALAALVAAAKGTLRARGPPGGFQAVATLDAAHQHSRTRRRARCPAR